MQEPIEERGGDNGIPDHRMMPRLSMGWSLRFGFFSRRHGLFGEPVLWRSPTTRPEERKRILRFIIQEALLDQPEAHAWRSVGQDRLADGRRERTSIVAAGSQLQRRLCRSRRSAASHQYPSGGGRLSKI